MSLHGSDGMNERRMKKEETKKKRNNRRKCYELYEMQKIKNKTNTQLDHIE